MRESRIQTPTSASLMLYLAADELVPKSGRGDATQIPCKEKTVKKKELAAMIFASAFWGLKEWSAVSLEIMRKRFLFFKTTRVMVESLRREKSSGLEGGILDTLYSLVDEGKEDIDVERIVYRWFGEDQPDPWRAVIEAATREAFELGLMVEVDGEVDDFSPFFADELEVKPDHRKIDVLEARLDSFVSRRRLFEASEPELHKALLKQCKSAIDSRAHRDTSIDLSS